MGRRRRQMDTRGCCWRAAHSPMNGCILRSRRRAATWLPSMAIIRPEIPSPHRAIPVDGSFRQCADHYQASVLGSPAFVNRAAELSSLAKSGGAAGVINWLLEEADTLTWDLPAQTAALAAAGIPFLPLSRRRWDAGDGTLEEIAEFTLLSREFAMNMLAGHKVVVLEARLDGTLARFLGSLGATLVASRYI